MAIDKTGMGVSEKTVCIKECFLKGSCYRYQHGRATIDQNQPRADLFVTDGTGRCLNFKVMPSDVEVEDDSIFKDQTS